jgi:hypothetical protein
MNEPSRKGQHKGAGQSSTQPAALLPPEVNERIEAFLKTGGAGAFVLDIKDGKILGWRIIESSRMREPKYAMK